MCGSTSRRFSAKVVLGILRNRGYLGEVSLRRTPSTRRRPHRPRSVRQGANVLAERGESYDRRFTDKHPEYLPAAKATATATTPAGPDSATAQTLATANASAPTSSKQPSSTPTRRVFRDPDLIAAQSIFTALLLTAANIRKTRAWRALTASDKTSIIRRARRRHASLRDYLPDG